MVFSSINPIYLDPPNWQQQQQQQVNENPRGGSNDTNHHLPPPAPQQQQQQIGQNEFNTGSSRANSMSDRARMAQMPQPESSLKCPRCESTNTKFCYFNNYNLSQPRHFCKTCRRYWTRGGALRNVPVGGGCRRNKRTKPSTPTTITNRSSKTQPEPKTVPFSTSNTHTFTSHLQTLTHLQNGGDSYNNSGNMGLNFGGIQGLMQASDPVSGFSDHLRSFQFPFLNISSSVMQQSAGLGLYPMIESSNGVEASVKVEENEHRVNNNSNSNNININQSRNFLGSINNSGNSNNQQYWGGNGSAWSTDHLPGFNSNTNDHHI